ncbi:16S rRNA (guanine(966)-N(2))-methyltransferase RsmD [Crocosphaera sp. UHCC 0190]|uniref:16S rRNA (guanine(966)-N(2))-methyltransferase RsmD n=1 Tax=Crocosphaera sp. UHCC 0190 TaxID=3110246 RepID=UPI002B1FC6A8|nr:16S rRNA (guanine(966)-N(2))-methyltransferase RsmD [Crocosphaera sp. UHCC 0190]MEA5512407.1 16S rRNA (guanine(966)-N(2))-methyltransferase RsmD [Crocosphaera sp. UHCC 0190]
MRIYGNRLIQTLPGELTRPTSAKVREALFNIWQGQIEGCRWLDLCAGNGSMGAEALCRGAKEVIGIEKSGKACAIINDNWGKVANSEQQFKVIRGDIIKELKKLIGQKFERIYFDPPYRSQLYQPVLEIITTQKLLAEQGELSVEHNPKFWLAKDLEGLEICRQKHYGNTSLTFYK